MIIGHLPAGYILGRWIADRGFVVTPSSCLVVVVSMLGAIAPDIDMFYFYFVDQRQTHHHTYLSHIPLFWVSLFLVGVAWRWFNRSGATRSLLAVFASGGLLHLVLDTIVGDIWWLAPFVDRPFAAFEVTARYEPWWWNFVLHWTFLFEIALWVWAYRLGRVREKMA